jgi:GNAT superfamily N-acetyltransferase
MKIAIRNWQLSDCPLIASYWLAEYKRVALPDAPLRQNAAAVLGNWLQDRIRDRRSLGYVADLDGDFAGFLLARVGEWESDPPILRTRRLALIDVLYVREIHRRNRVGTRLVEHAIERAKLRGVGGLETTFEVFNEPAAALWRSLGFVPSIQRAYRPSELEG